MAQSRVRRVSRSGRGGGLPTVRRVRRGELRASCAQGGRGGRRADIPLFRQVRAPPRPSRRDDADARANGRAAPEGAFLPAQVDDDRAVLPLRAHDEGPQARALPVEPRHHRRRLRARRGRGHGGRLRRAPPHGAFVLRLQGARLVTEVPRRASLEERNRRGEARPGVSRARQARQDAGRRNRRDAEGRRAFGRRDRGDLRTSFSALRRSPALRTASSSTFPSSAASATTRASSSSASTRRANSARSSAAAGTTTSSPRSAASRRAPSALGLAT